MNANRTNQPLIETRSLSKYFELSGHQVLRAVDGVSLCINRGEILGLVGESGCGKSTFGRTIKQLYAPTDGEILYKGNLLDKRNARQMKMFAKEAQMIFQDPYFSLNPRMTVSEIIGEGIEIHNLLPQGERQARIEELLETVGLNKEHANRFPHEFSGGQRQRVGIARALALNPEFIVCDEPISALDVSIQAQIVNLFRQLRDELDLTYLFIAHDLSMVKYISDRVAVMYLGKLVEIAEASSLYNNPVHPYTEFLMSAIPIPDPRIEAARKHISVNSEIASAMDIPQGCSFRPRCKYADESCRCAAMELKEIAPGHYACCDRAAK